MDRRCITNVCVAALVGGACLPLTAAASPVHTLLDAEAMLSQADLVFRGRVVDVSYRTAEPGPSGELGMPHTFVTYDVTQAIKGEARSSSLTLRFYGGPIDSSRFVLETGAPLFDVGDDDVLFVRGNTRASCPLVDCSDGRVRIVDGIVFTELGERLQWTPTRVLARGAAEAIDAIMTHRMSPTIEISYKDSAPRPRRPRDDELTIEAEELTAYLRDTQLARQRRGAEDRAEPFMGADIGQPFNDALYASRKNASKPAFRPRLKRMMQPSAAAKSAAMEATRTAGSDAASDPSYLVALACAAAIFSWLLANARRRRMTKGAPIGVLLALLASNSPVYAFSRMQCNGALVARPSANLVLEIDNALWNDQLKSDELLFAVDQFNHNVSNATISVAPIEHADAPQLGNGHSELFFAPTDAPRGGRTMFECDAPAVVEMDIMVNEYVMEYSRAKDLTKFYGIGRSRDMFAGVVLHELGHFAGLGHVNDRYSNMGGSDQFFHTNGSLVIPYLGVDTNLGLLEIYGFSNPRVDDIAVSHWEYREINQVLTDYSFHQRVGVFDALTGLLQATDADLVDNTEDTNQYLVSPGGTYQFEFTLENNGGSARDALVYYTLSADADIDPAQDRFLSSEVIPIAPVTELHRYAVVTIPSDVPQGTSWFFGMTVDPDNSLEEVDEYNSTYIPIQIQ